MNKFKNKILSVLLFAFTFFVIHDYVIAYSANATYDKVEVSQKQIPAATLNTDISIDELHEDIHAMLDTPIKHVEVLTIALLNTKPLRKQFSSITYIGINPNKPPAI